MGGQTSLSLKEQIKINQFISILGEIVGKGDSLDHPLATRFTKHIVVVDTNGCNNISVTPFRIDNNIIPHHTIHTRQKIK